MKDPEYTPGTLEGADIELLIADVSDAFWNIPLHSTDCRYFVIRFRGAYYICLRTAQGSRGAPLSRAAVGGHPRTHCIVAVL